MIYILVFALVVLMALTFISLLRGLNAFRQTLDNNDGREPGSAATELQLFQNKMMWSRIRYQFAVIAVVALMLMMAR